MEADDRRLLREQLENAAVLAHLLGLTPPVEIMALVYHTGLKLSRVQAALDRLRALGLVKRQPAGGVTWWFPSKKGVGR